MHYVYLRDYAKGKKDSLLVGDPTDADIVNLVSQGIIKPRDEESPMAVEDPAKEAKKPAKKASPKKKTSKKK